MYYAGGPEFNGTRTLCAYIIHLPQFVLFEKNSFEVSESTQLGLNFHEPSTVVSNTRDLHRDKVHRHLYVSLTGTKGFLPTTRSG